MQQEEGIVFDIEYNCRLAYISFAVLESDLSFCSRTFCNTIWNIIVL